MPPETKAKINHSGVLGRRRWALALRLAQLHTWLAPAYLTKCTHDDLVQIIERYWLQKTATSHVFSSWLRMRYPTIWGDRNVERRLHAAKLHLFRSHSKMQ